MAFPKGVSSNLTRGGAWCSNMTGGVLYDQYCHAENGTEHVTCDSYWTEHQHDIRYIPGIPGITSGVIHSTL